MKKTITLLSMFLITVFCFSQTETTDKDKIERACLNYLEGFYEGDTLKLKKSLQPEVYKFGFFKDRETENYRKVPNMTYEGALKFASSVKEKNNFAKKDAPKEIEILDIANTIAAAKVVAWWGIDYILLSKQEENWMIEQVLWEGPLEQTHLKE